MNQRRWRPFEQAREFVRELGLRNTKEWEAYSCSGARPYDIPSSPYLVYRDDWKNWYDWFGVQRWLPFEEARSFVHRLGFTTFRQWSEYLKSGQRPVNIPADPLRVYAAEFQSWSNWLGRTDPSPVQRWRPFPCARTYVHELGFTNRGQWREYCKSGNKPIDIPSAPTRVYAAEFQSWNDWLGMQCWRSFEEARAYARGRGFTSKVQWEVHAKSGEMPIDIPLLPETVYDEFIEYRDWLGLRKPGSGWRPFEEARVYVRSLGLTTVQQWRQHCKAREKPIDIPSDPASTYGSQFRGWSDWLGKKEWLPYREARAFIRTLGFTCKAQWEAYARSEARPPNIPSSPALTYHGQFRGYQDWLGTIHTWNKRALLALLHDLRASLASLQENELYAILDRSGAFPGLCETLQTSTQNVIKDLRANDGRELEARLMVSFKQTDRRASFVLDDALGPITALPSFFDSPDTSIDTSITEEGLHALDMLTTLPISLDHEIIEYLLSNRVLALWEVQTKEGEKSVDEILRKSKNGTYFEEVKRRYLAEKHAVETLPIPSGWAFTDGQGNPCAPNLMQRRIAWLVRERRRIGNWSGVGTGKTLSAILASRVIHARLTLIIVANATLEQWQEQVYNAYPDSMVYLDIDDEIEVFPNRHAYLLLNYEKFQRESRGTRVAALIHHCPDFIVLDEIHFVKQGGKEASHRREALDVLMQALPSCAVLGMSATPIINDLTETRDLLSLTIGLPFTEIGVRPTVSNALSMHRLLMFHGIRNHPTNKQDLSVKIIKTQHNDYALIDALRQSNTLLKIEQILLTAKLEVVRPHFRSGMLVYIQYVDEIVEIVEHFLENMGFKVGRFTGTEKSGLISLKKGDIDILIGSSAVGVGIDGLQKVCDGIIMLSLPWTHAAYEQIVGRVHRQGSPFTRTDIIIPQILLGNGTDTWSWDERRFACVEYKRTLSDCVLDGFIPETTQINQQEFLQQSYEALEQWITRVQLERLD